MEFTKEIRVPVICTRGVVVFPKQEVVIDVGRAKSLTALNLATDAYNGKVFVVTQKNLMIDDPKGDDLYTVGTICNVASVRKEDGFLRVKFSGIQRGSIVTLEEDPSCMMGTIEPMFDIIDDDKTQIMLVRRIAKEFEAVVGLGADLPREVMQQLTKGVPATTLADQFAQYFPMSVEKKQAILETAELNERLTLVLEELEKEKEMSQIEQEIQEKVRERVEENQKEYYLREKLRVIKEELGDVSNTSDDVETLRKMMNENPYPEYVKKKMAEELQRYEMMPSASAESSVIRTYLDWIFKVPWYTETTDETDLNVIAKRLDEDHFGLQKVKERILEYIAVKNMTKSLNAPILCLVGPPGVGKTSLAKSVARALDRKFVKMSLGGVKDEAEIRGHRRTYL
ncbi:MAG: LON peptidase substrate-binding domain-containing protein, partial [Erysipelotrichaceae bacterium]|nr:LON peptidase substrate-binding domain-containing protein [Erysipelotrichaceae bacterium]